MTVLLLGGEATDPFEDAGQSPDAMEQQARYLIGEVEELRATKLDVKHDFLFKSKRLGV